MFLADFCLPLCHAFLHENEHTVSVALIFFVLLPLDYAIILMTLARVGGVLLLAEGAGFEPAWAFALTVFKTAPL